MDAPTVSSRAAALRGLAPDDVVNQWLPRGLDRLSDAELVGAVAEVLSVPRCHPADSFELHAPLELMARASLFPLVQPEHTRRACQRIAWVAATYAAAGDNDDGNGDVETRPAPTQSTPDADLCALAEAVRASDLDEVDRRVIALAARVSADELADGLSDLVVPMLSAAGHGSILLHLLPRLRLYPRGVIGLARSTLRELARQPNWMLSWFQHRQPGVAPTEDLVERLRRPASPGDPGSTFIFPTMSITERSGLASDVLDEPTRGISVRSARRDLLRVAAHSMLQDDPDHAPYGWTHCLTMPQATLGIAHRCADPSAAIAVAATYVLGFRATLGSTTLDLGFVPDPPRVDGGEVLATDPADAAAIAWHASERDAAALATTLATNAVIHPDAHLAKYTAACIEAAADDPASGRLFLAAAAYLAARWQAQPAGDDPIGTLVSH